MLSRKVLLGLSERVFVIAFMVIFSGAVFATGTYDGGDGGGYNPFQIRTAEQLIYLSEHPEDWDMNFILTDDIDMDPKVTGVPPFTHALIGTLCVRGGYYSGYDYYDHDGNGYNAFSDGSFDGDGHVISNLVINAPDRDKVGFIGECRGKVMNLGLVNVSITGRARVGGLAGGLTEDGQVTNCYMTGTVSGGFNVGGLVGRCEGGFHDNLNIRNCYVAGTVTGVSNVGGLVGSCLEDSGNLAISNCYSSCSVIGDSCVGGLVGSNIVSDDYDSQDFLIINSYSTGSVSGRADVGGLVGNNSGSISYCYSTGYVRGNSNVGGLVGVGSALYSFWDTDTSGQSYSSGGQGRSTIEMQQMGTYSVNLWSSGEWVIDEGNDYPRLAWEGTAGVAIHDPVVDMAGSGTAEDPWQIESVSDLKLISSGPYYFDKHYSLITDLDLSGVEMIPIGSGEMPFAGRFNGNRHVISNLTINMTGSDDVGLFGKTESAADIYSLGLENVSVTGQDNVGCLVGNNYGKIRHCYSLGSVNGSNSVGGLIGNSGGFSVSYCYSAGTVIGGNDVGGLVGNSNSKIYHSYCRATVSGTENVGGLAGTSELIYYCYSTGVVSGTTNVGGLVGVGSAVGSFWDVETSGQSSSSGGTGLDTSQMQTMEPYSYANWSYGYWVIDEGNDYPRLVWEGTDGVKIADPPVNMAGSGTAADPYQITSIADLQFISPLSDFMDKYYILMNDLDLTGIEMVPIGTFSLRFSGAFDGGGHVISNLTINLPDSDDVGLFGFVSGYDKEIKNLVLENVSVSGKNNVGGLIGNNAGKKISRCSSSGVVNGYGNTGGLVGFLESGIMSQCFSSGIVNGDQNTGGLVGLSGDAISIEDCYSTADVNATGYGAGGFIGRARHSEINRCYSAGVVICGAEERYSDGFAYSGIDVIDRANGCFWDIDTSGKTNVYRENEGKVIGLNTAFMKSSRFYSYCGWSGDVWTIDEGNDYPRLAWENKAGSAMPESDGFKGAGTAEDPYKIESAADLRILSFDLPVWDKHFVLTADIDLAGVFMTPIGIVGVEYNPVQFGDSVFSGSFDGAGHVISNLSIDLPEYDCVGLFSYLYEAEVKSLGLENANVSGGLYVGALVGYNFGGNISQCFTEGVVDGEDYVGGFVGWNEYGSISDCYSICSVTGTGSYGCIGGFVARMRSGTINRCYSVGIVNGDRLVGGFVGLSSFDPYPLSDCFWDITVNPGLFDSGRGDLDEIEGLSTTDMKVAGSYLGWDFVGGAGDGELDIWRLCADGSDYPRLAWEFASHGDFVCPDGVGFEDFDFIEERYLSDGCGAVLGSGGGVVDVSVLVQIAEVWLSDECGDCSGGDVTGDGRVDLADFGKAAGQWGCSAPVNWDRADLNGDGVVDDADIDLVVDYWIEGF